MTVYWRVLPEEVSRNDARVLWEAYRRDVARWEVERLFRQVSDLPTKDLLRLYDAVTESMEETPDEEERRILADMLNRLHRELAHRETTEGMESAFELPA